MTDTTALPTTDALRDRARAALDRIGVTVPAGTGFSASSPITGEELFDLQATTAAEAEQAIGQAATAFTAWRTTPAPARGELVRTLGDLLRAHKSDLADLITIEAGKIRSEALGEVQEMIDICDFAVGLSRQLYGRTIASERPGHRLAETWHPLGVVGVISAFNFPAAVWSWNTAIALVCGDAVVWKPSELTPLVVAGVRAGCSTARWSRSARPASCTGCCWAAATWARSSSTTRASPSSAPPAPPGWAARSARASPPASAACCSSSAATTRPSWRRPRTWISPCRASCSPPPGRPGSAAPPCAG